MIQRCTNPNARGFDRYGGRGISVCSEWQDSFKVFFDYIGLRPSPQHSLDRFPDVDGNYKPGNVRWATRKEQQRNRRCNHIVQVGDLSLSITEWAERAGILKTTIRERLMHGWDPALAVSLKADRHRALSKPRKPPTLPISKGEKAARYAKEHGVPLSEAATLFGITKNAVRYKWLDCFGDEKPPTRKRTRA